MEALPVGITLVTVLLAVTRDVTATPPCAPVTDHFHSKAVNQSVGLICEVPSYQPNDTIEWIEPNGAVVSLNCAGSNSKYSVTCEPANAPTKFKLVFNATWSDRGTYTCKCDSTGFSMSTELTVKVPPTTLSASCTVKETGGECSDTSPKGSDVMKFTAAVGCAYPSATITWTAWRIGDQSGAPINTKNYSGVFKNEPCTGTLAGQRSGTSTFEVTWADLEKPSKVSVAAGNDAGGTHFDLPIHKRPDKEDKEDTSGPMAGVIIGVIFIIIIIVLSIYCLVREVAKCRRGRDDCPTDTMQLGSGRNSEQTTVQGEEDTTDSES